MTHEADTQKKLAQPFLPEELELMEELRKQGVVITQIAAQLGRNYETVKKRIYIEEKGPADKSSPISDWKPPSGYPKKVKCLTCKKTLVSTWPGHRRCQRCKTGDRQHRGALI